VSNSDVKLSAVTGFRIGAVAVTLGLPAELEHWTNEEENRDQDQSMDFSFDSVYDGPTIDDHLLFTMNEVSEGVS